MKLFHFLLLLVLTSSVKTFDGPQNSLQNPEVLEDVATVFLNQIIGFVAGRDRSSLQSLFLNGAQFHTCGGAVLGANEVIEKLLNLQSDRPISFFLNGVKLIDDKNDFLMTILIKGNEKKTVELQVTDQNGYKIKKGEEKKCS